MGVTLYFCYECNECLHSDCFEHCGLCEDNRSLYCDECTSKNLSHVCGKYLCSLCILNEKVWDSNNVNELCQENNLTKIQFKELMSEKKNNLENEIKEQEKNFLKEMTENNNFEALQKYYIFTLQY